MAHDATDQSLESSDTDIKQLAVEGQNLSVNSSDTQLGELDIAGPKRDTNSDAGDIITVEPIGDVKDELELPVSDILNKSDSQNLDTEENMLSVDGRSINGKKLQLKKPSSSTRFRSLGNGFEMGDMVWGKVKSHPWWPGYIFDEAFTSSSVWRTKKDGQVLVAFFGDSSYGWFDLAELVPYEPHFFEKSQQSTSRNFVKAVEESVDEACRRTALGLTCICRNPNSFRPTKVPGHIAVDVFDYEPGGIYTTEQIHRSRDNFQPEQTLSFIEKLAAGPRKATMTLDYMRERAAAIACRRAVFVEFDETYAEAFGHKAPRPIVVPPPTVDQSVQARFSGPLVIAESLSGRKSSTKAAKPREKTKTDRYLFKRRDEPGDSGTAGSLSSSPSKDQVDSTTSARDDGPASSLSLSKPVSEKKAVGEDKGASKESNTPSLKRKKVSLVKRSPKKPSVEKSDLGEKKKKRKTTVLPESSEHKHSSSHTIGVSGEDEKPEIPLQVGAPSGVPSGGSTDSLPAEMNDGKLEQVLSDLKALAVDPCHGRDKNRPKIAQHLFQRFRSLVFLKSQTASPPASGDTESAEGKVERKRAQSDCQEDIPVKRLKKASAVKSEKKPNEMQHLEGKGKSSSVPSPRPGVKMEPIKKQPPKMRVEKPTFLVMKYPPRASLPSSAELKARFARFGPMDTSQLRIFRSTYTCRILFLFKEDAESAFRFASGNKSAFANVRVVLRPNESQAENPGRGGVETDTLHQRPSSSAQLKSCLKKPGGDEGGGQSSGNGGRGARVRFNMVETKAPVSTASSLSVAVDVVHNNNNQPETFLRNPLHPPLVSPKPSVEPNYAQQTQTTRLPPPPPPPQSRPPPVDISQQMLSLLARCNDVVSDIKSILGYLPYHPL